MSMTPFYPMVPGDHAGKDACMVIRWLFRFVALFLGRKAWEAFQRRRQVPPRAAGPSVDGRADQYQPKAGHHA